MTRAMILATALCLSTLAAEDVASREAVSFKQQAPSLGADAITIPRMLNYQGKLTDTFELPVADTTYSVDFRLYAVSSGGSSFWNETQTIRTHGGLFSVLLGSVTPIGSLPDAGAAYLGMAVEGEAELTPRIRIVSAAYAYLSEQAADADLLQGKDTTDFVQTGQANSITSSMIVNGTIAAADLGQMGASSGQVMKWTGSAWAPRNDSVGGGGGGTVTSVSQGTGVSCTPNPITTTGTVALNRTYTDNRYVNVAGDSMSGMLSLGDQLKVHDKAALGYSCYNNGFAAFCAGYGNSAGGDRASITGGEDNSADGKYSHISGGSENQASALWATISGGNVNEATDTAATVGGGRENLATASHAAVAGGNNNDATGAYSFIGGGYNNTADTNCATVGGGVGNSASGVHAVVGGGSSNTSSGTGATVGGGFGNDATTGATVGGGQNNDATGDLATIGGGQSNYATDFCATIIGGQGNHATGDFSVILGGRANRARGYLSLAAGTHAYSSHHACFVWGDSTQSLSDSVYTTGSNQWHVRARGGAWFYSNLARTKGVYLAPSANSWAGISYEQDGSAVPVDRHDLLARLATVPVREYRLDGQDQSVRHIGPTAREYRAALGYGETEAGINMADADGVALAAIQALYEQNQALSWRVAELEARLAGQQ